MTTEYEALIARKSAAPRATGLRDEDIHLAEHLMLHQPDLVRWALRRGRAALFADTGLGKGPMAIEWARHVSERGRVLILAPLAVGPQLSREAARFGVTAPYVRADDSALPIVVTNYEMLHAFDPGEFTGVVLDESSILKSFDGKTRTRLIDAFRETPYKLACTATPAPNDFTELGNHSEFLGIKSRAEMLAEYFVHDGGSTQDWHLKGHAVVPFWRWVATWGAVIRMPSDLGYPDGAFKLPPIRMVEHIVSAPHDHRETGRLFADDARTLAEQRAARRATIGARAAKVAELVRSYVCDGQKPSTCATTTSATKKNGSAVESNKTRSTRANASSTQRKRKSVITTSAPPPDGDSQIRTGSEISTSERPTESHSPTTSECSANKRDGAPSVDAVRMPTVGASTSITITTPEPSGDCSAGRATSDSASSETASRTSAGPSRIWITSVVVWCELNDEQDAVAEALADICVSIQGSDDDEDKIERHERWLRGEIPVLVAKASQFGFGLNWQHCNHEVFAGPSNSYERTYQAIRRVWRYGQKHECIIDIVRSDRDGAIVENFRGKEADAARMAREMSAYVADAVRAEVQGLRREVNPYQPAAAMTLPAWMRSNQ
jgi:hypothetical protein